MVNTARRRFFANAALPSGGLALAIGFICLAFAGPAPLGPPGVNVVAEVRRFLGHRDGVWSVAFSADGQRALSASYDRTVRLWDVGSGKELGKLEGFPAAVMGVAFLPDAQSCVACCSDGSVHFRTLKDGKESLQFQAHKGSANALDISADGKTLVTGGADGLVRSWDVVTGKETHTLTGSSEWIWSVAISPDGKRVLAGGADKIAKVWDLEKGKEVVQLSGHQDAVCCVAFSPNGKQALTGGNDGEVRQWNLEGGQLLRHMTGHKAAIYSVLFSREGRHGFSAGADGVVRLWELAPPDTPNGGLAINGRPRRAVALDPYGNPMNVETGREMRRYEGHDGAIYHLALSRDGQSMLSCGRDATVRLWETRGIDSDLHDLVHPGPVAVAAFSNNGGKVLTVSMGVFRSWDAEKGTLFRQTPLPGQNASIRGSRSVNGIRNSPEQNVLNQVGTLPVGNQIAVISPAGQVSIWNADSATVARNIKLGNSAGPFLSVAFSPDGKEVITGDTEGKIAVWNLQSGKESRSTKVPGKVIGALALAPNGRDLLAATWRTDAEAKASEIAIGHRDLNTLKEVRSFEGHKELISGLAFAPNGQSFLSCSRDGTVRWWGLETHGKPQVLTIPGGPVTAVAFIDNERFASAGSDNVIRLWKLIGGKELQRLEGHRGSITGLAVSPAKNLLLSASVDRSARLWKIGPAPTTASPPTKTVLIGKEKAAK